VLLGARKATLCEAAATMLKADGYDARFIHLDLGTSAAIQAAAAAIEAEHGRLNVLGNNAGITDAADGPPRTASVGSVRCIFDINVFSAFAVTQTMLPLPRKSRSARVVNLSSGLGSLTHNRDPAREFTHLERFQTD